MTLAERQKFAALVRHCENLLSDKARQSETIFRGDMRAIVAAAKEIERLLHKVAK